MFKRMGQHWVDLWKRIGAQGDGQKVYSELTTRYSEKHRAYHTLAHIDACLNELEQVRHLAKDPDAIEMALWYHDAVYETQSTINEEKSAALFREMARGASLTEAFISQVVNLILVTKHVQVPNNPDAQLLVDIDLSILGQTADRFDEYEQQVRKEYEWVPTKDFIIGRSKILKSFLERPTIYSTNFFRNKYEISARINIDRSLTKLSQHS